MAQLSQKVPPQPARRSPLWFASLIVVGMVAGSFGSRLWTGSSSAKSGDKLSDAIHDYQSGDETSAISLLQPLVQGKNAKAEYWLANIYFDDGLGQNADKAKAVGLLEKSAGQGFVPAEGRLGELYMNGDEVLQDFGKSQTWLRKAATSGDVRAQRLLGHTYELGLGIKQDVSEAYGWYENAAKSGNVVAQRMRDTLLARMSQSEVSLGEADAKTILAEMNSSEPNSSMQKGSVSKK